MPYFPNDSPRWATQQAGLHHHYVYCVEMWIIKNFLPYCHIKWSLFQLHTKCDKLSQQKLIDTSRIVYSNPNVIVSSISIYFQVVILFINVMWMWKNKTFENLHQWKYRIDSNVSKIFIFYRYIIFFKERNRTCRFLKSVLVHKNFEYSFEVVYQTMTVGESWQDQGCI